MKYKSLKNGVLFVAFFAGFFACKKADYRDVYIGNWIFDVVYTEINTDSIGHYYSENYNYDGEVVYGEADDEVLIKYADNHFVQLTLEPDGELSNFPTHYCSGRFVNTDSLSLFIKTGGLGGGTTLRINGCKK